MEIRGRRIMVTGASGGLGAAMARELARRGADLVLTARRRELLEALAAETGGEVVVADLADRTDVDRLAEDATGVDVLVLNAGVGSDTVIEEESPEHVDATIDVNLRAPIHLSVAFAQHLLAERRHGQIVLVGSLSGLAATPNTRMYNATKFGLRGFAHSLRQDLDGSGIGVTLVSPGFIRDAGMFAEGDIELPPGVRTKTPQDVADAVVTAITSDPAEVFVSPIELRLGATLATVAPGLSATIQKRIGTAAMKSPDVEG
ncbi:SDR family NAD(P)-dependent oxidoreductase [Dermatobacter hominis]|uniref:SDR family NAD(P)-dependent oxidoreductase n=1 Tax=Dermatobacter hominis TaxID=2884263 RepID=UPI001D125D7E|nr:SDR family NAD(P)-dependent oxidoreductase [Dermatobacter hominis]UDY34805.1 SDR family NAD(P)-dependent oxidoreductase [Dermatobacter hominis]